MFRTTIVVAALLCGVQGAAFAGLDPVTRVEWTDDDGATWQDAEITYTSENPHTWRLWSFDFAPAEAGERSQARREARRVARRAQPRSAAPGLRALHLGQHGNAQGRRDAPRAPREPHALAAG